MVPRALVWAAAFGAAVSAVGCFDSEAFFVDVGAGDAGESGFDSSEAGTGTAVGGGQAGRDAVTLGGAATNGGSSGGAPLSGASAGGSLVMSTAGASGAGCELRPWEEREYVLGERVLSTCKAPYNGLCPADARREFECQPPTGPLGLGWCKARQPGVGNGWQEAWLMHTTCT